MHAHGFKSGGPARDRHRRTLIQAARNRAVAEAELQVGAAWLAELERMRAIAERGLLAALSTFRAAEAPLREAQTSGDVRALADAQLRLQQAYDQVRYKAEVSQTTLQLIAQELETLTRTREGRDEKHRVGRAGQEKIVRLWGAWQRSADAEGETRAAEAEAS